MPASEAAAQVDELLAGDPDVAHWTTYVGRGAIRFYLPLDVQLPNDFFAQVVVVAKDVAARERLHQHTRGGAGGKLSRAWSAASRRWGSARPWAGRCSIASAAPI